MLMLNAQRNELVQLVIYGITYNSSVAALKAVQKGLEASTLVHSTYGFFCSNSMVTPSPASLHH